MKPYPKEWQERRKREFIRDINTRNAFGISWGCMKNIFMLLFILALILLFLYYWSQ